MDLQKAIFKVSKRENPQRMIFMEILKNIMRQKKI